MTEHLIKAKPLRILYIPLAFSSVETTIKGFNGMSYLENFIEPVDLLVLYLENRAFWEEPNFDIFKDFKDPFLEGDWHVSWNEDIIKAREEREMKNEPISSLTVSDLLSCEVSFNGNLIFFVEREVQQHKDVHSLLGAILAQMAKLVQCEIYQQYPIFDEFCRLDSPIFINRKGQDKVK